LNIAVQVIAIIIVNFLIAYAGWYGRGLHEHSKSLVALEVAVEKNNQSLARESEIAKIVIEKLSTLEASERVIDRGIIREIEKPMYRNVCLSDDAVRMLNEAARGPR
jgi:cell division protein FtsB